MIWTLLLTFVLAAGTAAAADGKAVYLRAELRRAGLTVAETEDFLNDPRLQPIRPLTRSKMTWAELRTQILADPSVERGRNFLQEHAAAFAEIEAAFGIGREHIAALVRVESDFGANLGADSVAGYFYWVLTANSAAKRWQWAAQNLAALAAHGKHLGRDPFTISGSHAGAIGLVQFLPYSVRHYAKDGDGDGVIDLFTVPDALASAANYLKRHGWKESRASQVRALQRYYGNPRLAVTRTYAETAMQYAAMLLAPAALAGSP